MAQEEARTMLDALMGADRNAPLPRSAVIPRQSIRSKKKKRGDDDEEQLWLSESSKRRAVSCYDPDIDPLYVAWGVDVYELFVNTKSDLGANPFNTQRRLVDHETARREYLALPPSEKLMLGFDFKLFQKLSELVKSCDRIVQRNKEKLHQELQQKQRQKAASSLEYHVETIDEATLESLVRSMVQLEHLQEGIEHLIQYELVDMTLHETKLKNDINDARQQLQQQSTEDKGGDNVETGHVDENKADIVAREGVTSTEQSIDSVENNGETHVIPESEPKPDNEDPSVSTPDTSTAPKLFASILSSPEIQSLQMELGRLTLQKQKLLVDIAYKIQHEYVPLKEAVEKQTHHLQQVKSDTTTDKTVCEVSGNFMSARDADERIAAHYAGKQYVGWKLVRNKFRDLVQEYGRNGPPRPNLSPSAGAPPYSRSPPQPSDGYHQGGAYGGGSGGNRRPAGVGDGRYDRGGRSSQDRGGGGGNYRPGERGSGGGDWRRSGSGRRSPSPQFWERRGSSGVGNERRSGSSGGGNRGNWRR